MQSTAQRVTSVVMMLMMLMTAAPPAMAKSQSTQGPAQVCDEDSYDNKVDRAAGRETALWGSLDWDGDAVKATVADGYTVELCVKGGRHAFDVGMRKTFVLAAEGAPQDGTHVIEVGTQISHVAWSVLAGGGDGEPAPVDVDLQLTSVCLADNGTDTYELYDGEKFHSIGVADGQGVVRVTNTGSEHSSVTFNVGSEAVELGDNTDDGIEADETEFYAVPAGRTIIVTDANGDTATKAQNDYDCDLTSEGDPVTEPHDGEERPATPVDPGQPSTPGDDNGEDDPVTDPQDRVGGSDRVGTAVEVSQMTYPDGADMAFVARDDLFPDALAAGPLAALHRGPILLTDSDTLSAVTAAELDRLDAADGEDDLEVVVLGGPAAVSPSAFDTIDAEHATDRIGGIDRFQTAALIAAALDTLGDVENVYVATGRDYPDAMVAGWASGLTDGAVLLAEADDISGYTTEALRSLDEQQVYAVGGPAVLSDDVVERLGATRVAGPDRYATTAEVATMIFDRVGAPDTVYLTTGDAFADTLTIAPTAILGSDAVLLVGTGLPQEVRTALTAWAPQRIVAVGGTAAVSDAVLSAAKGS